MKKQWILKVFDGASVIVLIGQTIFRVFGHRKRIPVLVYHKTSPLSEMSEDIWNVTPTKFRQQLQLLKKMKYKVLPVVDLQKLLRESETLPDKTVCITFDDGYADNFKYAIPELEVNNFTADFYISTKYIDDKKPFEFLSDSSLSEGQLSSIFPFERQHVDELRETGFGLHSHAHEHIQFQELDESQIDQQIRKSFNFLRKLGVKSDKSFVVPYGAWGPTLSRTISVLKENQVESAFMGAWGSVKPSSDLLNLPRLPVYGCDSNLSFYLKISGACDWLGHIHKAWHNFRIWKQA